MKIRLSQFSGGKTAFKEKKITGWRERSVFYGWFNKYWRI